jgi:hypothetical protein
MYGARVKTRPKNVSLDAWGGGSFFIRGEINGFGAMERYLGLSRCERILSCARLSSIDEARQTSTPQREIYARDFCDRQRVRFTITRDVITVGRVLVAFYAARPSSARGRSARKSGINGVIYL